MANNGDRLTPRQVKAAIALASGSTLADAAKASGAGERSITRWRNENEQFQAEVLRLQKDAYGQAIATLSDSAVVAAKALKEVAENRKVSPFARVQAAQAILSNVHDMLGTQELLQRMKAIEVQLAEAAETMPEAPPEQPKQKNQPLFVGDV